ncbi:hypothetical protein ES703_88903 [subsurface metagenome]
MCEHFYRNPGTVLTDVFFLEALRLPGAVYFLRYLGGNLTPLRGCEILRPGQGVQFFLTVSCQFAVSRIASHYAAIRVIYSQGLGGTLEQIGQEPPTLFAFLSRFFSLLDLHI